jgi:hypothetical protein
MLSSHYDQVDTAIRESIIDLAIQFALKDLTPPNTLEDPIESFGDMGYIQPTAQDIEDAVTEALSLSERLPIATHTSREALLTYISTATTPQNTRPRSIVDEYARSLAEYDGPDWTELSEPRLSLDDLAVDDRDPVDHADM